MSVVVFIPARYASTRYPAKPLVPLAGATGEKKTLIERTWRAAQQVKAVDAIYVLTDHEDIAAAARSFGADVLMTSSQARNGTERCAEAVSQLAEAPDIIVNFQGDAPLTPPSFVEALIEAMAAGVSIATPVIQCDREALTNFVTDRREGRVGGTTVVLGAGQTALYFSKEVLPYIGNLASPPDVWHHVGVYAYTPDALIAYASWEEGPLERAEGLEQLRFLENANPIHCVPVTSEGRVFWELNNPVDVGRIEEVLRKEGIV